MSVTYSMTPKFVHKFQDFIETISTKRKRAAPAISSFCRAAAHLELSHPPPQPSSGDAVLKGSRGPGGRDDCGQGRCLNHEPWQHDDQGRRPVRSPPMLNNPFPQISLAHPSLAYRAPLSVFVRNAAAPHDARSVKISFLADPTKMYRFAEGNLVQDGIGPYPVCLLYTSPSPRDRQKSRMPSSA